MNSTVLAVSFLQRNPWVPAVVIAVILFLLKWLIDTIVRRRDKNSKHLDYQVLSDTPIVTSRDKPEILKVMFGATEVKNPYITEVRVKNTGKQVIKAADFLSPVVISRNNAKVLDFNDVDQSEQGLIDSLEQTIDPLDNDVAVRPTTLNPGDWFTVQVIYDSGAAADDAISVTARIEGRTRDPQAFEDRERMSAHNKRLVAVGGGLSVAMLIAGLYGLTLPSSVRATSLGSLLGIGLLSAGSVLLGAAFQVLWSHRFRSGT